MMSWKRLVPFMALGGVVVWAACSGSHKGTCNADSDCTAQHAGFVCVSGLCLPAQGSSSGGSTGGTNGTSGTNGSSTGGSTGGEFCATAQDGADCGSGKICYSGTCQNGCYIGLRFVPSGALDDSKCASCDPSKSTTQYTQLQNGASCGNAGLTCQNGQCGSGCDISGTHFDGGAANPGNACQACIPANSPSDWSNVSAGTSCGAGSICFDGGCLSGCYIGNAYVDAGAVNPDNACTSCQPNARTGDWTYRPDGTACGTGQVCSQGICKSGCYIGGAYYTDGQVDPNNACQKCQASTNTFVPVTAGTSCNADGKHFCSGNSCVYGCNISGVGVVAQGQLDKAGGCQSCQPTVSTTQYSAVSNGTACSTNGGNVCDNGTCQPGCWISGSHVATGAGAPGNECQTCQPAVSISAYTNRTEGTSCGPANSANFCHDSGSGTRTCQAGCFISGAFYAIGASNPNATSTGLCQYCAASSATAWTSRADGYDCASQSVCSAGSCQQGCYVGQFYAANAAITQCTYCNPAGSGGTHQATPRPSGYSCRVDVTTVTNTCFSDKGYAHYDQCDASGSCSISSCPDVNTPTTCFASDHQVCWKQCETNDKGACLAGCAMGCTTTP